MVKDLQVSYLINLRNSNSIVKTLQEVFDEIKSDKSKLTTIELNDLYESGSELYTIKKKVFQLLLFVHYLIKTIEKKKELSNTIVY